MKTFDSTGISPGGVLFAGDLNNIQDHFADLTNLSQTVSTGTLAVGEAGLTLSRFATGIMRVSGQLRVDSVVNALSGFQVNGTPLSAIHLSEGVIGTGRVVKENTPAFTGTPTAPTPAANDNSTKLSTTEYVDRAVGVVGSAAVPAGVIMAFGGSAAPGGFVLCQGQAISRTSFANLFSVIGTSYGPGDGSTTFNVPDLRRRVPVGLDSATPFNTLGNVGGEETHLLTVSEIPAHSHTGTTGTESNDHTHSGNTGGRSVAHTHTYLQASAVLPVTSGTGSGGQGVTFSTQNTSSESTDHSHAFTTGGRSASHTHSFTTNNTGGGTPHNNLQPYVVVNFIIKT